MTLAERVDRVEDMVGLRVEPDTLRCHSCWGALHTVAACPFPSKATMLALNPK